MVAIVDKSVELMMYENPRHTMTEYPEDYPTLSAGPPPVMYSDHV